MRKNEKNEKVFKKYNVDYCYNPQRFWCGGIVIPSHYLEYCVI